VKFQLKTGETDQFSDQWHDIEFKLDEEQKDTEDEKK